MSGESNNEVIILFPKYPTTNLSEEEIDDPNLALDDFFSFVHLPEAQDMMWLWMKATVTGSFPISLEHKERNDILNTCKS